MKKLLSYLYPMTREIATEKNGIVRLTYHLGKKLLGTKNANYSYGSLQRILKYGLEKIDLRKIESILLLGLGGGSVIETLREDFGYTEKITAIEIDEMIIEIAQDEFSLGSDNNLEIIHDDAVDFVARTERKFDLIIIDIFIDTLVPESVYRVEFWQAIYSMTHPDGYILWNASMSRTKNLSLSPLLTKLEKYFHIEIYERVRGTNTLLIGKKLEKR